MIQGAICLDTLGTAWSPVLTIKSAVMSLQSLLNSPEPNDPQDAVVAQQMKKEPQQFAQKAREWAMQYAGAPKTTASSSASAFGNVAGSVNAKSREQLAREELAKYKGYNKNLIDRFVDMGFDVEKVVAAFKTVRIPTYEGRDHVLEEAYMGDITAVLLHEP